MNQNVKESQVDSRRFIDECSKSCLPGNSPPFSVRLFGADTLWEEGADLM